MYEVVDRETDYVSSMQFLLFGFVIIFSMDKFGNQKNYIKVFDSFAQFNAWAYTGGGGINCLLGGLGPIFDSSANI